MRIESAREIDRLLGGFGSSADNLDPDIIRTMISFADGFPATLVARVVDKFIAGQIKGQSLEFPPKPPLFATALRSEPRQAGEPGYESREDYLRRHLPPPNYEPSPEQKAHVSKLLDSFRRANAEKKQDNPGQAEMPMTEDQAEYWSKIMAIGDRQDIGEEERRRQGVVSRKINGAAA